ncbi:hypothetical protein BU17DRAFT_79285 [Hysterangium stoloniferum]|nr:hypothetical protein BU17DRAFT_79285 [Hysterangium stoloniferum]
MLLNFTFQEASPLIVYSAGQWTEGSPTNDTAIAVSRYDGSFRVTQINGATATLNFLASGISLFGALRDNHGNYTVNLDQDPQITASGFSTVNTFKQPLFQAPSLAYTYHQVTITNLIESTGPFLDLDFVTIERHIGQLSDQAFQETLDDNSSSITYSPQGSWSPISSTSAMQNTLHQTTVAQAQVTIQFQGCCIEMYGHYTNARYTVTLDNGSPVAFQGPAVDLNLQQQHPKTLLYLMDDLSEDSHNVTITNSDSNAARPFYFDYAVVWTTKNSNTTGSGTGTGGSRTPIAPIVGGIVGGLLVFAILATVAFLVIRRRRGRRVGGSKPETHREYTPVPYTVPAYASLTNIAEGHTQTVPIESSAVPTGSYNSNQATSRFPTKGQTTTTGTSSSENRTPFASTANVLSSTAYSESTANAMSSHAHTRSSPSTGSSHTANASTLFPIARSLPMPSLPPSKNRSPSRSGAGPSAPAIPEAARITHEEDAGPVLENSSSPTAVTLPPAYNPTWHQ